MIDPLLGRAIELGLGFLLLFAAWHKASAAAAFSAALRDYRLLPAVLLRPVALVIPSFEALLGLCWLVGFQTGTAALMTAGLLNVYALAITINLWRGRSWIGCGCGFGTRGGEDQPLSWWLVLRNLLLGMLALMAALPANGRLLVALDWLTLVLALLASGLLYLGASQLLRNGAAIAAWRKPRG